MSGTIRQLFSPRRPIDRTIEKVIDYYTQEEDRLSREVSEYEVTDNLESCFRKFLDAFGEGVRGGQVTEIGIWVSGFYGSGKSSFTKYLGAALDPTRTVQGKPFLDLLCERFPRNEIPAALRTVSKKHPTAVVLLDLGAEQLAESAAAPVSTVLYWKVLQWAGFSKEKKTAQLEFTLERRGKYEEFRKKYRERYQGAWDEIHNDPLIGVARAAEIVPAVLPDDFPTPESFRGLRFEEARDIRDKRNSYVPTSGECTRARIDVLKQGTADHAMFRVQPAARLENIKEVRAAVRLGRTPVAGGSEEVELRLEFVDPALWEGKRTELLVSTNAQVELKNTVMLLFRNDEAVEELLPEIVRSEKVPDYVDERSADLVVAQYLRAERRAAEWNRESAAVLGGVECALPDEITWAKAVFDALETGAEADVRNARAVLDSTAGLESLFPGSTSDLLGPEGRATAEEVLSSERFHERLPELRSVIRVALDRAESRYTDERAAYEDDLKKALTGLEADPDWTRLLDEDREAIAARLSCDLPQTTGDSDPVRLLQTLLVRKRTLPGLIEELRGEIKRKRPAGPELGPGEIQEKTEPFGEEVVEPGDLLQPALIATSAELSPWLDAIRAKIEGLLRSGKRVRIKGILE